MSGAASSSAREYALDSNDITLRAADRLEMALERLTQALEARLAEQPPAPPPPAADTVSRAEVAQISARLDLALDRLRTLMGEDGGADL